jgi:hypothetical protein
MWRRMPMATTHGGSKPVLLPHILHWQGAYISGQVNSYPFDREHKFEECYHLLARLDGTVGQCHTVNCPLYLTMF